MKQLLIGAGSNRDKKLGTGPLDKGWDELVTLDYVESHNPDVVWDLRHIPYPFAHDEFDEVHAYEVFEHLGQQGDYESFFAQFSELWRILKPNGLVLATVPWWDSKWAWGDPSHTRTIQPETLVYLSQTEYTAQVGITPMSDFRTIYKADFEPVYMDHVEDTFVFVLRANKGLSPAS